MSLRKWLHGTAGIVVRLLSGGLSEDGKEQGRSSSETSMGDNVTSLKLQERQGKGLGDLLFSWCDRRSSVVRTKEG